MLCGITGKDATAIVVSYVGVRSCPSCSTPIQPPANGWRKATWPPFTHVEDPKFLASVLLRTGSHLRSKAAQGTSASNASPYVVLPNKFFKSLKRKCIIFGRENIIINNVEILIWPCWHWFTDSGCSLNWLGSQLF